MLVLRVVGAQLRHRVGRSMALILSIVVAVTSFTVLTGTSEVSRLRVVGQVEENFRAAYDILVRPVGSSTGLEANRGLVRNNFLSGLYGGIGIEQYEDIKQISGVDVAAPIAVLGYQSVSVSAAIAMDQYLDSVRPRQAFRLRTSLVADRGLSRIPGETSYFYATTAPLTEEPMPLASIHGTDLQILQSYETLDDGRRRAVCPPPVERHGPFDRSLAGFTCYSSRDARSFSAGSTSLGPHIVVAWPVSYIIAAIDPAQEARLAGLDAAVVRGRYLTSADGPTPSRHGLDVPFVMASEPYTDERVEVLVERLPGTASEVMTAGLERPALTSALARQVGVEVARVTYDGSKAYDRLLEVLGDIDDEDFYPMGSRWTATPVEYEEVADLHLRPRTIDVPESAWSIGDDLFSVDVTPWTAEDVAFRTPTLQDAQDRPGDEALDVNSQLVGVFDPDLLPSWSELSGLPMETYSPPAAEGWDDGSRELLGGRRLLPSSSPTGYLASPPLMLTTLSALDVLADAQRFSNVDPSRPISAVRVRVAGVEGPDAESMERVRLVAEEIVDRTGLDVDITIGSSPTPMRVDLAAGRFGRPELALREEWVQKGVAVTILDALDRKSFLLFVLILLVCGLLLANAAAAAARTRRVELGVLACLGWSSGTLCSLVVSEVLVIGLAAGLVAGLLSPLVAAVAGVDIPADRGLLAVGASVGLAMLAGLWPAIRASRLQPAAAVSPVALPVRRHVQPSRQLGLAVTNLMRMPGRLLVGAFSIGVGVCALTLLLSVTVAFRGVLVGTLLGDAISVQTRAVDYLATAVVLALAAVAVADVLYLSVRERAAELAALQATGWTGRDVGRLILLEGTLTGLFGSVVGAGLGLAGAAVFANGLTASLLTAATMAVLAGTVLAGLAAAVPARLPGRLPIATLLAQE